MDKDYKLDEKLLTLNEAAAVLRVSKSKLRDLMLKGDGPIFIQLGPRKFFFRECHLEQYITERCKK
jgi:predicted DNA-binding transcriptional regulator AlpA